MDFLPALIPAVVLTPVITVAVVRRGAARSPAGIVKRLTNTPGLTHIVHIKATRSTWDPTKPVGWDNHLYGPGVATYTLTDDGLVHVLWRATVGKPVDVHLTGPIPDQLRPQSPQRRFARKVVRLVVLTYVAAYVAGFGLGYGLSDGSIEGRIGWGALGVLLAWFLIATVVQMISIGLGTRSALRQAREDRARPPTAD